jgi:hypothetical protein
MTKFQTLIVGSFWNLGIGICLEFGICVLEFSLGMSHCPHEVD